MKKTKILLFAFLLLFLVGCSSKKKEIVPTEITNVSAKISNISLTGATITITDTREEKETYTEWYRIEKEENGLWNELETITNDYGFNDIAYTKDDNNQVVFIIDWSSIYGELGSGSYRILKEVGDKYIAVPFSIANTYNK